MLLIRIILEIYIVYFLFAAILNLSERLVSVGIMDKGFNPFMPTVPTFAVRETSVSRTANVGNWLRKRNGGQKWVNFSPMMPRDAML